MTGPRLLASRWCWWAVVLLALAEFLLFDRMTSRYHASVFPRWTDQTQYLGDLYGGYEKVRAQGFWSGLAATFRQEVSQGKLHDTLGVVVFTVAGGPSRSAALSLNMLAFVAWQLALFLAIGRASGSRAFAWVAFALPLALAWPWSVDAGTAVDFRLDHAAMCLLGVSAALGLLTDGFRSWRWSLAFGFAVGITVVERFLCGLYFALMLLGAAAWIAAGRERGRRFSHLFLAALVAAVVAFPFVRLNWSGIVDYYVEGHLLSAEGQARAPGLDLLQSLQFIGSYAGRHQLGPWFGVMAGSLTALLLAAGRRAPRPPASRTLDGWLFLGLVFLLVPGTILALHKQKSEFVLGELMPGLLLLVLWAWHQLWRRIDHGSADPWVRRLRVTLPAAALALGGGYFVVRQVTPPHPPGFMASARQVNAIADYLYRTSRQAGLTEPRIVSDQWLDALHGRTMTILCYERQKHWLTFNTVIPRVITEMGEAEIFAGLEQSDFVLLTDDMVGNGYYPLEHQLRRLYPQLKAWCEAHHRRVATYQVLGCTVSLYQRRDLP